MFLLFRFVSPSFYQTVLSFDITLTNYLNRKLISSPIRNLYSIRISNKNCEQIDDLYFRRIQKGNVDTRDELQFFVSTNIAILVKSECLVAKHWSHVEARDINKQ